MIEENKQGLRQALTSQNIWNFVLYLLLKMSNEWSIFYFYLYNQVKVKPFTMEKTKSIENFPTFRIILRILRKIHASLRMHRSYNFESKFSYKYKNFARATQLLFKPLSISKWAQIANISKIFSIIFEFFYICANV